MNAQEVPPEQQLTPPEKVEQVAAAYLQQEQLYLEAMVGDVVNYLDSGPERAANMIVNAIEQKGTHNLALVKFRLGQPIEIREGLLVDLAIATTWQGWAVRFAILLLFIVAVAKMVESWMLPPIQPVQKVHVQQQGN